MGKHTVLSDGLPAWGPVQPGIGDSGSDALRPH